MNSARKNPPARRTTFRHGDLRRALLQAGIELAREGGPRAVVLREATRSAGLGAGGKSFSFIGVPSPLGQVPVQQNQRLRKYAGALGTIYRFCPLFRCMASAICAGHKDHTHGRNASDEHAIVTGPAGQPGAFHPACRGRFLNGVLYQWRTCCRRCLAQQRDFQVQPSVCQFPFDALPQLLLKVEQSGIVGAAGLKDHGNRTGHRIDRIGLDGQFSHRRHQVGICQRT